MALKRYSASADTTIVNAYQQDLTTRGTGANAGMADVLETFSIYGRQSTSSAELSRILVQFPIDDISDDRTAGTLPASGNVSFYLRMFNAPNSRTAPKDLTLVVHAVSQSWQEGVGLDLEGYRDLTLGNEGSNWMSASNTQYWTDINGTLLAGGSYHTQSAPNKDNNQEVFIFKQTLPTGIEDLEINVTPLVEQWIAGTYSNYGVGVHVTASQAAYESGSLPLTVSRIPGNLALDEEDSDGEEGVLYNPSGSTTSYYTKRFFARGSQFFFKRPRLEARWNDITRDDRGNFYYSSSMASGEDNLNTIYLYNYVRGRLTDIPNLGSDKRVYVSIYSGSVGGFYSDQGGGDGDDIGPIDIPISGTTSANTGSIQVLSPDGNGTTNANVRTAYPTVITGGAVATGIYSASFAFTGSTLLNHIYDVWFTGSHTISSANDAEVQFFTGAIAPMTLDASPLSLKPSYFLDVTNLKNKYHPGETVRFNLFVRDKNWSPNIYTKATNNIDSLIIESGSYRVYRLLDGYQAVAYGTGSDLHTGLSYDVSGNYFDFDMNLLEPGYAYGFKFAFYDSAASSWVEQNQTFKFRVEDYEY
tara:strand:- start:20411 stop:22168 length:1758 start_codon:yes stop_codon:yes gene_type:complete